MYIGIFWATTDLFRGYFWLRAIVWCLKLHVERVNGFSLMKSIRDLLYYGSVTLTSSTPISSSITSKDEVVSVGPLSASRALFFEQSSLFETISNGEWQQNFKQKRRSNVMTNFYWKNEEIRSDNPLESGSALLASASSHSSSHKVVHLNTRPTQLYYQGVPPSTNDSSSGFYQQQVCEIRVPIRDVYVTFDDANKAYMDVFFLCNGWCCGVDCCRLNFTFMFAIGCVAMVVLIVVGKVCVRTIGRKLSMHRAMKHLGRKRRKRFITRANAHRYRNRSVSVDRASNGSGRKLGHTSMKFRPQPFSTAASGLGSYVTPPASNWRTKPVMERAGSTGGGGRRTDAPFPPSVTLSDFKQISHSIEGSIQPDKDVERCRARATIST